MPTEIGYYDDRGFVKVLQSYDTHEHAVACLRITNKHEVYYERPPKFEIVTWVRDSNYGHDQKSYGVLFDPRTHNDKESAAIAFYKALRQLSLAIGEDVDSAVTYEDEGDPRVVWESGPYEWGIVVSSESLFNSDAGWYTEPQHSFDVCFTE